MIRILSLLAILAAGLPLLGDEEPTFEIKLLDFPAAGKSVKAKQTVKITEKTKVVDENGAALKDEKKEKLIEMVYTEKTIEGGKKKAKKFSRNYSKADETKDDKTEKMGFSGRTVVFTLDGKKYKLEAEGKPALDEKSLADLESDANKDPDGTLRDNLMPKKAVKVGETWKLEPKNVAAILSELALDKVESKGTGKLVKAYKKNGKQYGIMEFTMTGPGKAGGAPGKAEFKLTADVPIDGSSATGKLTSKLVYSVDQTVEQNGMKFKVEIRVLIDGTTEREDIVEKK